MKVQCPHCKHEHNMTVDEDVSMDFIACKKCGRYIIFKAIVKVTAHEFQFVNRELVIKAVA